MKIENGRTPKAKYLHDVTYHGQELSFTEAKKYYYPVLGEQRIRGLGKRC
ncbi:ethylmalonyl-CoA decarboxylase-like isoform X3, partial [Aphis craccivora]